MNEEELREERQALVNQHCLDTLLRRLGTSTLRIKFKEFYAKLHGGKEWTDGRESGRRFCCSKWGKTAFALASGTTQEMMTEGNIQNWDLYCLKFVIVQMLTTALKGDPQDNKVNTSGKRRPKGQGSGGHWEEEWYKQMLTIQRLGGVRNVTAHMPNESLPQEIFDEKWGEAVDALKKLGVKQEEIEKVQQISQFFDLSVSGQPGQGHGHEEIEKEVEELRAKIQELQIERRNQNLNQVKIEIDEVKGQGQVTQEKVKPAVFNKKNELKAKYWTKKGDLASKSGEWNEALEFYTKAIEIPDTSDDRRRKIYMNRSWVHLRILQLSEESSFDLSLKSSEVSEETAKKKKCQTNKKLQGQNSSKKPREPKFVNEKLLNSDPPKRPIELTDDLKKAHLTSGMTDLESVLQLSGQNSAKALHRLGQFHQLKGDWPTALTFFDRALDHSDLGDVQLEWDRDVCQLEVMNETEVEEFKWIIGQTNQTMVGLFVRRNPARWRKIIKQISGLADPDQKLQVQLQIQILKAHFLAHGLSWENPETYPPEKTEVTEETFHQIRTIYEEGAKADLPSALYNLGLLLQEGHGAQSADFSRAIRLFKIAASHPIDDDQEIGINCPYWTRDDVLAAKYRLGLCYEYGLGVGKDGKKALHWYETASLGDHARASRKLGDIYAEGRLGVSKDMDMAIFCWEHASIHGDTVGRTSAALQILLTHRAWFAIGYSLSNFSKAIRYLSYQEGTDTMLTSVLDRKRDFQSALSTVLQELTQSQSDLLTDELVKTSWNIPAFVDHTLDTLHLLEMVQTPEFQKNLREISPNWRSQPTFVFTDRLLKASDACVEGLGALQGLTKLYRDCLMKGGFDDQDDNETEYPPDLRRVPGVDTTILQKEGQLVTTILTSFALSIRLVGAALFRDQPTQSLILKLVTTFSATAKLVPGVATKQDLRNHVNCSLIFKYILLLQGEDGEEGLEMLEQGAVNGGLNPLSEPLLTLHEAAVQGSLGKFEGAAGVLEKSLKKMESSPPVVPEHVVSKSDLLFVQAVCLKSAGLTRGVNSGHRKKIKEAMGIFAKFLSNCPKDDPRRAEAHYHLGLCTLHLEKMKVKGQDKVKCSSSTAQDILDKVMLHFKEGEAAEQELPWKGQFSFTESRVKVILQQELEALVKGQGQGQKVKGQTDICESSCFGRLVDPSFKFPVRSFPLKLKNKRRVGVITEFRRLFKAVHCQNKEKAGSSSSFDDLEAENLMTLLGQPGSSFTVSGPVTPSVIVGCYEIKEPLLYCRLPVEDHEHLCIIPAFTVVQDESGSVFNLHLNLKHDHEVQEFQMGSWVIIFRPDIRLDMDGGTSLLVIDAEAQVFFLSVLSEQQQGDSEKAAVTKKCGFCGKIGEKLHNCAKCQTVYYCGKECQTADWTELKHNWICPFLKPPPTPNFKSKSSSPGKLKNFREIHVV